MNKIHFKFAQMKLFSALLVAVILVSCGSGKSTRPTTAADTTEKVVIEPLQIIDVSDSIK